jgi:pimeloyl-ACP methyl ester carboxylesterase
VNVSRAAQPAITRVIVAVMALLAAAGLLALHSQGALAGAATPATPAGAAGPRPVIVLEHGAWADASSWDGVIARLHADGYTVYAPPDPLRGLAGDSAYLHDFLTQNAALAGQPVILVGHSYGGAVISDAAVGDPEVKALVYVDAFIPAPGESISALLAARPGSCIGGSPAAVFDPVPYPGAPKGDVDLYLQAGKFPGCFASGLPASQAAVLAATQRPLTASAATAASGPVAWKTVPSWAVVGTLDKVIPPAELSFMARRAHARITDIPAGHLSLISRPGAVARVIARAAHAAG